MEKQAVRDINNQPYNRLIMVIILMTGSFCTVLNQTILATAYPTLMRYFSVNTSTVQWLTTGFLMVNGMMIPVSAYLSNRLNWSDVNQFRIHSNHQYRQLVYNLSHSYNYTLESAEEIETGYQVVEQNATKEVIEVQRSQAGRQKLNLSIFKGVYYRVLVNGKSVKVPVGQNLTVNLKAGLNRITIITKAPWWNYLTLAITLITWLVLLIIIFY